MEKNCNNLDINELKEIWKDIEDSDEAYQEELNEQNSINPEANTLKIADPNSLVKISPEKSIKVQTFVEKYWELNDELDEQCKSIRKLKSEIKTERTSLEEKMKKEGIIQTDGDYDQCSDELIEIEPDRYVNISFLITEFNELAQLYRWRNKNIEELKEKLALIEKIKTMRNGQTIEEVSVK